ncbi:FmdE family protein [Desulfohalovibrio reitneri]|uniref:FmdE family protein n=1 Tax=Desulfohalovibrio reitneri TaxID=1307759 RepID=UPI000A9D5EA0
MIDFHGHSCPGLTIGVRAAEMALRDLGHASESDLVAVVETDMCGVDAIQFLTGCTFGKGNLVHRDYGKMAFSFYDRSSGKGVRLLLHPEAQGEMGAEMRDLMGKSARGEASEVDRTRLDELREAVQRRYMELPLEVLFEAKDAPPPPSPARILETLTCAACGEGVMESRSRRMGGETLCIPCFQDGEQKR